MSVEISQRLLDEFGDFVKYRKWKSLPYINFIHVYDGYKVEYTIKDGELTAIYRGKV